MNRSVIATSSVGFIFLIFFGLNGISDKIFSRFYADLTQEGLYTLSSGSKSLIGKLENPVTLKFYYSKSEGDNLPIVKLYGSRVADLLREYQRVSKGLISVEIIDPKPDSEDEEWAEKYGINPMSLPTGQKLFMGLVAISGVGEEAVIPVFDVRRQEYLEYDITKLVYSLDNHKQPVVGVLSALEMSGDPASAQPPMFGQPPKGKKPWIIWSQMSKLFSVKHLPLEMEVVPDDVNLLFVVHPRGFSQKLQYAIDQFVMRGGNLVLLEDPFAMTDSPPQDPSNPMANFTYDRSSNLNSITSKWGFKLEEQKIVTDRYLATAVNTGQGRAENFIAWLSLTAATSKNATSPLIENDVVTNNLENIMYAWGGALSLNEKMPEGVSSTILLRTTEDAMLMDEKTIRFSAENPNILAEKHVPGGKQLNLALKLTGTFESNFDTKPEGSTSSQQHIKKAEKSATILVFSDVDFTADDYSAMSQNLFGTEIVNFLNDNQTLALNALDNLTGNADLIALRSRGRFTRPFTKIMNIEAEAQDRYKDVEKSFQQAIDQANERLSKLQAGMKNEKKGAMMNDALLSEIQKLREDKREAQRKLREVRLALRQDKEFLGSVLFVFNTFFVPMVLIALYIWMSFKKKSNPKIA